MIKAMKDFYKLFNAGTSDSVRRAWVTRHNLQIRSEEPFRLSYRAWAATKNDQEDHLIKHQQAFQAHQKAAEEYDNIQEPKIAEYHRERAKEHQKFINDIKDIVAAHTT